MIMSFIIDTEDWTTGGIPVFLPFLDVERAGDGDWRREWTGNAVQSPDDIAEPFRYVCVALNQHRRTAL